MQNLNLISLMKYGCISLCMVFLVACQPAEDPAATKEMDMKTEKPAVPEVQVMSQQVTATVKYIELEGGFIGLETKGGDKYLPRNLPKEYHIPGTIIRFKATTVEGVMTTQQWGTLVNLSDIELVKKAVNPADL